MKKLLAVLLAITIVMSMGVVAFAAHDGGTHGIDSEAAVGEQKELATSGGSQFGKTDFYLNIDKNAVSGDTQISATIPLWVCMYAYGGDGMVVTPADAYKILNTGTDTDIKVYAMRALPQEGWTFNTFDSSVFLNRPRGDLPRAGAFGPAGYPPEPAERSAPQQGNKRRKP